MNKLNEAQVACQGNSVCKVGVSGPRAGQQAPRWLPSFIPALGGDSMSCHWQELDFTICLRRLNKERKALKYESLLELTTFYSNITDFFFLQNQELILQGAKKELRKPSRGRSGLPAKVCESSDSSQDRVLGKAMRYQCREWSQGSGRSERRGLSGVGQDDGTLGFSVIGGR